jgi:hypothetical protein
LHIFFQNSRGETPSSSPGTRKRAIASSLYESRCLINLATIEGTMVNINNMMIIINAIHRIIGININSINMILMILLMMILFTMFDDIVDEIG